MTILEAITRSDEARHNRYDRQEKIQWLSRLDGKIALLVHAPAEGEPPPFPGYTADTDLNTPLLAGAPFDELYLYWLEAQMAYYDGETGDYNNAIAQYNALYDSYSAWYRRTHLPKAPGPFRF